MENKLQHTCATSREFTLQFLEHITNNFSEECIIGRGGYGVVYKGVLEDGEEIAVKKLHHMPGLDDKQFRNEFNNFMRAQHQNIVRLVGYCYYIGHQRIKHNGEYIFAHVEERLLCFEYLHGGSLDKHISDESCGLDWPSCYKIIKGVCEGLNHLHNGSKDHIYHLDLKPANILLDKDMMPKIGDFGLSRLFPSEHTYITTKTLGTRGYMPPEYIDRYQITRKFDVFSLGVIIIQIMAGRHGYSKFVDMPSQEFIEHVHEDWRKRLQAEMLSHTSHEVKTCIEIALRCVEADRVKRPTIAEIVDELTKLNTTIADELNEFDTAKTSPMGQVSDLRSKQAFNQFASSGWRLLPLPEKLPVPAKSPGGQVYRNCLGSCKVRKTLLRWLLLLWVVGWLITCFWIFFSMNSLAIEDRRKSLAGICDERARMLQDQFNFSRNYLQNLAILISTFHHSQNPSALNQTTFARYAERTAFELPLTGLVYAVRVMHAEREQFEWLQGWSIKKMPCCNSSKKSPVPEIREPVEEYAPVIFAQDAYKDFLSFDMLSSDVHREAILRARESGKGVLTAPCKNCGGVTSAYTVYKSELPANARPQERIQAAIGYLHGIFDIEELVDKLPHQLAGKQSIMVNVYDTTNERPIRMYCSNDTGGGMYHKSTLNFGDPSRKLEMHCRFMQSPPWPWLAITLSLGTLAIALLTGHIFHATVHRIAKVEDDFQNMMELKKRAEAADVAKSQFHTRSELQ